MVPPPNTPEAMPAGLDIAPADWQQTPPSVQTLVVALLQRLEALEARLSQDSRTSQRPPSADSPHKKARRPSPSLRDMPSTVSQRPHESLGQTVDVHDGITPVPETDQQRVLR